MQGPLTTLQYRVAFTNIAWDSTDGTTDLFVFFEDTTAISTGYSRPYRIDEFTLSLGNDTALTANEHIGLEIRGFYDAQPATPTANNYNENRNYLDNAWQYGSVGAISDVVNPTLMTDNDGTHLLWAGGWNIQSPFGIRWPDDKGPTQRMYCNGVADGTYAYGWVLRALASPSADTTVSGTIAYTLYPPYSD